MKFSQSESIDAKNAIWHFQPLVRGIITKKRFMESRRRKSHARSGLVSTAKWNSLTSIQCDFTSFNNIRRKWLTTQIMKITKKYSSPALSAAFWVATRNKWKFTWQVEMQLKLKWKENNLNVWNFRACIPVTWQVTSRSVHAINVEWHSLMKQNSTNTSKNIIKRSNEDCATCKCEGGLKELWIIFLFHRCGKSCPSKTALTFHKKSKHGEKDMPCHICGKLFATENNLRLHLKQHGERKYICNFPGCDKSFIFSAPFREHLKAHTGIRDFVCEICSAAFCVKSQLKNHMVYVHGGLNFTCELCHNIYKRPDGLRTHFKRHHKDLTKDEVNQLMLRVKERT